MGTCSLTSRSCRAVLGSAAGGDSVAVDKKTTLELKSLVAEQDLDKMQSLAMIYSWHTIFDSLNFVLMSREKECSVVLEQKRGRGHSLTVDELRAGITGRLYTLLSGRLEVSLSTQVRDQMPTGNTHSGQIGEETVEHVVEQTWRFSVWRSSQKLTV